LSSEKLHKLDRTLTVKAGSFDCNTSLHHHAKTGSGASQTQRQPEKACTHTQR